MYNNRYHYNLHSIAGMYDSSTVRDMLKECAKMYNFDHSNVLTLKGVCLDGGTAPFIIMPFMANGSLLAYLKKNRETLVVSLSDKHEDDVRKLIIYSDGSSPATYHQ